MNGRVLLVAFHFPPFGLSSGSRRTLAFARYLPGYDWQPHILTADVRAYELVKDEESRDVPEGLPITRAFAFDAARDFSVFGRYPKRLAVPDRWMSWQYFACNAGLRVIRASSPGVIWSTYPIATAHMVAAKLHVRTGIPWVADMRDPMVELDPFSGKEFPRDRHVRESRLRIEKRVAESASHVVFCTEAAREIFVDRFDKSIRDRTSVIPNGYDEEAFLDAERSRNPEILGRSKKIRIVHSGSVYSGDDRGPDALLEAIKTLHERNELPEDFRVILRATGNDDEIGKSISRSGTAKFVELAPPLPYRKALEEMLSVEGLLLLQGSASNPAVPAKLYEYFRAQRPILALVHESGETAKLLRTLRAATIAPLDDSNTIADALRVFIRGCIAGNLPVADPRVIQRFSRKDQTRELAELLSRISET